jgi:hypothetical protein
MKEVKDVTTFMNILNTVSNSMDTNLTTKQILSFYNVGKDIMKRSLSSDQADLVNIQQLYLQGIGQMIYDERAKMVLWDYVPNKTSRDQIVNAMKVNLELKDHEDICEFSFSINKPYEKKVVGYGVGGGSLFTLLPDFTGDTEAQAQATANRMGIKVKFEGTGGTVIEQNYPANKRVDLIKDSLVLKLSGTPKKTETDDKDKKKDDDDEKDDDKEKTDEKEENPTEDKTDDDTKDKE